MALSAPSSHARDDGRGRLLALAERGFLALSALGGFYFAFAYVSTNPALFETGRAALGLLRTGTLSDPYAIPTGPTAHVPVLTVLKLAALFRLLGENSEGARMVLSLISAALFLAGAWCLFRLGARHRLSPPARLAVLAVLLLTVWQLFHCVVLYRQVDQPAAAALLIGGWLVWAGVREAPGMRGMALLGLLSGIAVLLSPSVFLALGLGAAAVVLAAPWRNRIPLALAYGAVLALFVVPWVLRNQLELGAPVLLRSNFGLELWFGNAPESNGLTWVGSHWLLHPSASEAESLRVREMGELAYIAELRARAVAVILEDPARFVALTLRRAWHLLAFLPRPPWSWSPGVPMPVLEASAALFGLLKVAALATLLVLGRWRFEALAFFVAPLVPFMLTHVYLRYTFLSYFASVMVIGLAAEAVAGHVRARRPAVA